MALAKPARAREPSDPLRVLIVEDQVSVAAELRDRLDSLGMKVAGIVETAEAAIRTACTEPVDLVLMDLRIPGDRDGHGADGAGLTFLEARHQMLQAQKTESLGRLASGVAHDFNNLLAVINGCTELALRSGDLSPATRALLNDVVKAGARAANLTRQFLNFARKDQPEPRVLDLNSMVRDSGNLLRRLLRADIEFVECLAAGELTVLVAATHVEQIVMNLVLNARDAMPDGGRITIQTSLTTVGNEHPDADAGEYAVLAVSDTGQGIAESVKPHIFEPWFTTKDEGKGTGVGLATIYSIVNECGGFIVVDSEPGLGTTFRIHLPFARQAVDADSRESETRETLSHPYEGYSVLVVEDEPMVRGLVAGVLRHEGYTVVEAAGAQEAATICAQNRANFDLMITDVMMPGLKGPELANQLRRSQPGLRVLYMTGYADEIKLPPHDRFIQKPFALETLTDKVRDSLAEHAGETT